MPQTNPVSPSVRFVPADPTSKVDRIAALMITLQSEGGATVSRLIEEGAKVGLEPRDFALHMDAARLQATLSFSRQDHCDEPVFTDDEVVAIAGDRACGLLPDKGLVIAKIREAGVPVANIDRAWPRIVEELSRTFGERLVLA